MSEVASTVETAAVAPPGVARRVVTAVAWRNLWRNRRRTWLTAGGIAFAVWMLVVALSMQDGTFEIMIDNGARLLLGHVEIQHPAYADDPRIEHTLTVDQALLDKLDALPGLVTVAPRLQAYALVSAGERSFGAQILGVDPTLEASWSTLPSQLGAGRYLAGPGEAVLGAKLARNIGVAPGGEIVVLGSAPDGSVAAMVARVVGTLDTGQAALDRSIVEVPIADFREAWSIPADEVHALVIRAESVAASERLAARLEGAGEWVALDWRGLMPDAVQTVQLKAIGAYFLFSLVAIIVTFSVVNTFMMTVFERTPEFGMLMAIGMKPGAIMLQLQLEALWLALLGVALGLVLATALIVPLSAVGMPLPVDAGEILRRYNMPDRMYPAFSLTAAWLAAVIMLAGTQLAAVVPGLRIRRLSPVAALRAT